MNKDLNKKLEVSQKQKDLNKKQKKFKVPKGNTNFLKNTLLEYKRCGKSDHYQITHKAKLIPYNDHTGLDLKEIPVIERETWKRQLRIYERRKTKIVKHDKKVLKS